MTWQSLITNHRLTLSPSTRALCREAWRRMRGSIDPIHGTTHINSLLDDLDLWLRHEPTLKKKINWDILLPALGWHDTWKATHFGTSIGFVVWAQLYEGIGSAHLFKQYAQSLHVAPHIIEAICYAIRKHSLVQFLEFETLESQILFDLDTLALWDIQRLETVRGYLRLHSTLLDGKKDYFTHLFLRLHTPDILYHEWPRGVFSQRRSYYFQKHTLSI